MDFIIDAYGRDFDVLMRLLTFLIFHADGAQKKCPRSWFADQVSNMTFMLGRVEETAGGLPLRGCVKERCTVRSW